MGIVVRRGNSGICGPALSVNPAVKTRYFWHNTVHKSCGQKTNAGFWHNIVRIFRRKKRDFWHNIVRISRRKKAGFLA
jgi:hypothetical protein